MSTLVPERPEVIEFLKKRRSHLAATMEGEGPSEAQVRELIQIASRVPDHKKLCPWRFVVYAGDARKSVGEKLAKRMEARQGELEPKHLEMELNRFLRAPLVIGVISSPNKETTVPVWEQELSSGAACMNLLSAAGAMGFAAQWLTEWYAFDEDAAAMLGAKDGERFAGFIHIGQPSMVPSERPRPEIDEVLTHWSAEG